jgi:hypothetical protein
MLLPFTTIVVQYPPTFNTDRLSFNPLRSKPLDPSLRLSLRPLNRTRAVKRIDDVGHSRVDKGESYLWVSESS